MKWQSIISLVDPKDSNVKPVSRAHIKKRPLQTISIDWDHVLGIIALQSKSIDKFISK